MFDRSTYVPGDPWTSTDFYTLAITSPKIAVVADSVNDATPASYFENRSRSDDCVVEVGIERLTGSGAFVVALERSFNEGVTWSLLKAFSETFSSETISYKSVSQLRLRVTSLASGTLRLRLRQDAF